MSAALGLGRHFEIGPLCMRYKFRGDALQMHVQHCREEGRSEMESNRTDKKNFMEAWLDDLVAHMESGLPPYSI